MTTKTAKLRPTHLAFVVDRDGRNSTWTEIGAAWPHEDGKGFHVSLKALPLTGKLVLRARLADREGSS
jgi:hypothetical protein